MEVFMMNKKVIAGLAALALFCGSVPAYNAFLTETSISAGAVDEDIAAFLGGYIADSKDSGVKVCNDGTTTIHMAGRTYTQGITVSASYGSASISYDVSSINELKFTVCHVDDQNQGNLTLSVIEDDVETDSYSLTGKMNSRQITVDTSNAKKLTLKVTAEGGGGVYGLADFQIDGHSEADAYTVPSFTTPESFLTSCYDYNKNCTSVFATSDKAQTIQSIGRTYYQGIVMSDGYGTATVSYNVENVDEIGFTLGHVDNGGYGSAELHIYLDGVEADTIDLINTMSLKDYKLDTSDASVLRFDLVVSGSSAQYALMNVSINGTASAMDCTIPAYKSAEAFLKKNYDCGATIYANSDTASSYKMNGRTYYEGIVFNTAYGSQDVRFNVEQVDTIGFTIGHVDNSGTGSAILHIYKDGIEADTVDLSRTMAFNSYQLDVSDASVVRFSVEFPGSSSAYALADLRVDSSTPEMTYTMPKYSSNEAFLKSAFDTSSTVKTYADNDTAASFVMNGERYLQGITFVDSYGSGNTSFAVENVDSVSFTLGHIDESGTGAGSLTVYVDEAEVESIDLTAESSPKDYTIDTKDASMIRFLFNVPNTQSGYAMANVAVALSEETEKPTEKPTEAPSEEPTEKPSEDPSEEPTEKPSEDGLFGDVNADGVINAGDAADILQYAAYVGSGGELTLKEFLAQ